MHSHVSSSGVFRRTSREHTSHVPGLHQVFGQFLKESGRTLQHLAIARLVVDHRIRQVKFILRPGDRDVEEPALLLQTHLA